MLGHVQMAEGIFGTLYLVSHSHIPEIWRALAIVSTRILYRRTLGIVNAMAHNLTLGIQSRRCIALQSVSV